MYVFIQVILFGALCIAHPLPEPKYASSEAQYARAKRTLEQYVETIRADADFRPMAEPLFRLHPPGTKTHGTVLVWHGGSEMPANAQLLGRYLFDNGFNVFLPPLAGHSLNGTRQPYTLLRDEMGGSAARKILLADEEVMSIVKGIENGTIQAPVHAPHGFDLDQVMNRILRLFKMHLSPEDYENVMAAFNLLIRDDYYPGLEMDLFKYFETDHFRYDSISYEQVAKVIALPGPIYASGFSMGGTTAMFAAARSKLITRAVLFAPFFESAAPEGKPSYRHLLEAVGVLDPYLVKVPGDTPIWSRILPAVDLAGRMAAQDEVTRNIREHTATFCVLAEDNGMADYPFANNVCRGALRNENSFTFSYPKEFGVNHFVAPGSFNRFSKTVARETLRFLTTGSAHLENMVLEEGDKELPPVPPADVTLDD